MTIRIKRFSLQNTSSDSSSIPIDLSPFVAFKHFDILIVCTNQFFFKLQINTYIPLYTFADTILKVQHNCQNLNWTLHKECLLH